MAAILASNRQAPKRIFHSFQFRRLSHLNEVANALGIYWHLSPTPNVCIKRVHMYNMHYKSNLNKFAANFGE